ncbi:alpha-E domain-containing protein [Pelagibacterium xiamenense]|uniref:alpha-E domain-containing protein n=1 Tax=Pelagibacterium xiamenense TaxID=2901140 RepID=UPI001E444C3A|nr:alpha-E domain-containing protein [Pelagibacterium xiamenense]MCD7059171.1 alpha-E domain-containing protein [Pelagibacterium xiamenense]
MLGRTAASLFWMSRYVERAENIARLLEVGYRMSLTERSEEGTSEYLASMMLAAEVDEDFAKKHEVTDVASVAHFMLFDTDNPNSVKSCLEKARTNAKAVRTAITSDMWESLNSTWLHFSQIQPRQVLGNKLPGFLQWVKQSSHEFRGALLGSILRDDGFAFAQTGGFIERADNTARILDVKYYVLLPRTSMVGGDVDIQQWTMILRAASAHRAYRHVYHDRYKAWNIADFLIFRKEMPRSLAFCVTSVTAMLGMLEQVYGEPSSCHDDAIRMAQHLTTGSMDKVFSEGLHEYLTGFIASNNALTTSISESYNFY